MNIKERLEDAQKRRQDKVTQANELRKQAQQLSTQGDQYLLDANKIDGEIEAYTLLLDEETGAKPRRLRKDDGKHKGTGERAVTSQ